MISDVEKNELILAGWSVARCNCNQRDCTLYVGYDSRNDVGFLGKTESQVWQKMAFWVKELWRTQPC